MARRRRRPPYRPSHPPVGPRPGPTAEMPEAAPATPAPERRPRRLLRDHRYVLTDLWRVGIATGIILAGLAAARVVLR
ncbi:MAG TPA: hypothetical protein VNL95_00565 [Dehalococcoidia bacterium]|nr:hypothetical protein [Dehalococcoidia bacterium]